MAQTTLAVVNNNGSFNIDSLASFEAVASSYSINSNDFHITTSKNDIQIETYRGNLSIIADIGILTLNSNGDYSNAILIEATNVNGGITQTAGTGGINLNTSNGDINLLSQGSNINIGVSPVGTPAYLQTQNITLESFNNFNVSSGDMYFVSSDVISFVSNTGDIQFGTSSNGAPVLKFENGNVLINQSTSDLDYQLDVAVTHPSDSKDGFNGIVVNTTASNVAADLTLQTSNALGDGTQCILSMGSFGSDNKKAVFQKYLAYQTGNVVIRLDGPAYSPNALDSGFGHDFVYADIGRQIYWTTIDRLDTITALGVIVMPSNDTSNLTVTGTYTGNTSRVYLLQIDSLSTPNTFMWSNNGGVTFQQIYVPIIDTITPIALDSGLSVLFSATTGFAYNQQFTFQTKITAIVTNPVSIPLPETMYTLQQFYSYIETTTPSDIVIRTNSHEKMRITGDGAIGIQKKIPTASLDLDSNYNKVLLVNQTNAGYQLNPSIAYLESGGYVVVWNSQDTVGSTYNFNVQGQLYMSDGSRNGNNFTVNNNLTNNQSFPFVAGNRNINSNHYIVVWGSNHAFTGFYNIYCQIYHNNTAISTSDIIVDSLAIPSASNQLYPRCAGLYNGNYVIVWAADDTGSGIYAINCAIIGDNATFIRLKFQINVTSPFSRNYPYVAGLPSDDLYYPNGFVVSYMTAIDTSADPRYTIALRVSNFDGLTLSAEIPITSVGSTAYSSISDGLLSLCEINKHIINNPTNNPNPPNPSSLGSFILTFYRSYQADATLYNNDDGVNGLTSGSTASIAALYPSQRIITLKNISNRFLISEEINIASSNVTVGNIVEKIAAISFITNTTANITLDVGSKDVMAYSFNSNIAQASDAFWSLQVNTSPLYNDLDRFTGNSSIYTYKRPLSAVSVDNNGVALITWSNGSIPSVYYQLINTDTGEFISTEQRLTSQYDGLKQRDQVVTHLQSIGGNDYGFVVSWDNQSLDLQDTGIYQQLVGYNHSLFNLADGNCNLIFNHQNQLGVGVTSPESTLHMKSQLSSRYDDPANTCSLTIQNTSEHIITKEPLQSINFIDGMDNILNRIESRNSLRHDDLYPQPTNLVGFYKFDHSTGTQAVDYSSSSTFLDSNDVPVYVNTNAILVNFDIENCWTPGLINNALLFNGNDNYLYVESNALNKLNTILEVAPRTLSLSLWVNVPSNVVVNSKYDVLSNGGDLSVSGTYLMSLSDLTSNGNMVLTSNIIVDGVTNIGIQGTTKLNDSQWHHIVETVDMSSGSNCIINLYVDGVLENTVTTPGNVTVIQHQSYKTYIGSSDGNLSNLNYFRGYMDELRFYNSIISSSEITQLYKYGNPNLPANAYMVLSPNANATYNQAIVIDDDGKINNLSSRPLPYTILSGEIVAYKDNVDLLGINTNFINELTVGDIIVLGINQTLDYTIISIIDNTHATIDRKGYVGPEVSKSYLSVLRRPSINTYFDNSDSIRGHVDNYGNMMIGDSRPTTMLEISNNSNTYNGNTYNGNGTGNSNLPELTITNTTPDNTLYSRKTAVNFKGYNAADSLDTPISLGRIETSHNGTGIDTKGIMKFSVNNGTVLNTVMSFTSNGNIGIGGGVTGQNTPLTLVHATMQDNTKECELLLQSDYNASGSALVSSIFDERSDIYFGGLHSITETIDPNIKMRVLSAISGSNDSNTKVLNGRLDFLTNNQSTGNGIESRMSINHTGNVGVSIMNSISTFQAAPERTVISGQLTTIVSTASGGTVINLSNNLFSGLSTEQKKMFIGGLVVVENNVLSRALIVSVLGNNQIQVNTDLSDPTYVGATIHIHYAGINIDSANGFTGVNTVAPGSVLSVNGSMSLPITTTSSSITLDLSNYTIICNTASNPIIVSLPTNGASLTGRIYIVKRTSITNTCTVDTVDSALIDGASSISVTNFAHVQSDGTNWWVIASG